MFEWFKKFDVWFSKSVCQPIVDKTGVMPRQLTINCLMVALILLTVNYFLFGLSFTILIINMLAVGFMVALFTSSYGKVLYENFGNQTYIRIITIPTTVVETCFHIGLWYVFLNKAPTITNETMIRNTITIIVSVLFLFAVYFSTCKTPPPKKKTENKKISLFKFLTPTT